VYVSDNVELCFWCTQPVGCDGRIESDLRYDSCAVCGGDGSTCAPVDGSVSTHDMPSGRTSHSLRTSKYAIERHAVRWNQDGKVAAMSL